MISTMIERDFLAALESQQQSLAANQVAHAGVLHAQHYSRHWFSVLIAGWWPTRSA